MNEEVTENLLDSDESKKSSFKKPNYKIFIIIGAIIIIALISYFGYRLLTNSSGNQDRKSDQTRFNIICEYNGDIFASVNPSFSQAVEIKNQTEVSDISIFNKDIHESIQVESVSFAVQNDTLYYYDFFYDGNSIIPEIGTFNPTDQSQEVLFEGDFDFDRDYEFKLPVFIGENVFLNRVNYDTKQSFLSKIDLSQNKGKGDALKTNEGLSTDLIFDLYNDSTLYPILVSTGDKGYYLDRSGVSEFKLTEINPDGTKGEEINLEINSDNSNSEILGIYPHGDVLYFEIAASKFDSGDHMIKELDLNNPANGLQDVYSYNGTKLNLVNIIDNQLYLWDCNSLYGENQNEEITITQVDLSNSEETEAFKFNLNPEYFDIKNPNQFLEIDMAAFVPTESGYYFELRNEDSKNEENVSYILFYYNKDSQEISVLEKRQNRNND